MKLGLPANDVYYLPQYGLSAELIDSGTWECAIDDRGDFYVPYLRREIPNTGGKQYDIISPYGYGGVCHQTGGDLASFRRAFLNASKDRGLVAEFIRTHPFDYSSASLESLLVDSANPRPTFGIAIETSADDYFDSAEGRHRTSVRKARKAGLEIIERPLSSVVSAGSPFRRLYDETMERVGAQPRLRLGTEYFERLNRLGPSGGFVVEVVSESGEVVAASSILSHGGRLHYHLSGSTREGQRLGATNLLIDWVVRHRLPNDGRFHLGGGVTQEDGLEKFKRSVSNSRYATNLCRTTVNKSAYDALCQTVGVNPAVNDFFPAYRTAR
jgi:serine/alanine adding enzyme